VAQVVGTVAMYAVMRLRVPWLRFGKPRAVRSVLKPLISPALASGAFPAAVVVNMQGMVLVIGLTLGPASVAIFSTLRTVGRAVTQVVSSVAAIVTPEISRAFGVGDQAFVHWIHRRACQVALWMTIAMVVAIALSAGPV